MKKKVKAEISELKDKIKSDKKLLKKGVSDSDEKKELKAEIKTDKEVIESDKVVILDSKQQKSGKVTESKDDAELPNGVDTPLPGTTLEAPKKNSKLGQVKDEETEDESRRGLKSAPKGKDDKEPTKSPSTGIHKPTWKPSSKPAEHSADGSQSSQRASGPKGMTATKEHDGAPRELFEASNPTKSPSTGIHKPTWKPSSKPAEHSAEGSQSSQRAAGPKGMAATKEHDGAPRELLQASNTKFASTTGFPLKKDSLRINPSIGSLRSNPSTDSIPLTDHLSPVMMSSASDKAAAASIIGNTNTKPAVMKNSGKGPLDTATRPTKSPSTGLHKPTWKPSSKPTTTS